MGGALHISQSPAVRARGWINHYCLWPCVTYDQYDARTIYGYLPIGSASPLIGRYQIILHGNRGTCVRERLAQGRYSKAQRLEVEPATCWSQSAAEPPNHYATDSETHEQVVILGKYLKVYWLNKFLHLHRFQLERERQVLPRCRHVFNESSRDNAALEQLHVLLVKTHICRRHREVGLNTE